MIAISWETLTEMTIHLRKTLDFGVQCTQFLDKSRWIASQSACLYITCGGLWRHKRNRRGGPKAMMAAGENYIIR